MRVIAGTQKGRALLAPPRHGVRPTSDKVREALFSIVGPRIQGARVLDLYAGTGAIGIEALSRGAECARFVESQPAAQRVLRANLTRCGLTSGACVSAMPVSRFLRTRAAADGPYDLVFADPPYQHDGAAELVTALSDSSLVAPTALVVIEHATRSTWPDTVGTLACLRHYRYGDTTLSVYTFSAEGMAAQ